MQVTPLKIKEVILIEPRVFSDDRGFFYESFNQKTFQETCGLDITFVQDNHSKSSQGVLRGLHYQSVPYAQGKLIRVLQGEIFDVAVDIRPNSESFGQWVGARLSAENKQQLWIPGGFAHGFLTLSETAEVAYKTTEYYNPESEKCLIWNDADVNIKWPGNITPHLSHKDTEGLPLSKLVFGTVE